MTTTSKEHRQRRYRMAVAYLNRRAYPGWAEGRAPAFAAAYNEWVDSFPKFMVIAYPGAILRSKEHGRRCADSQDVSPARGRKTAQVRRDGQRLREEARRVASHARRRDRI